MTLKIELNKLLKSADSEVTNAFFFDDVSESSMDDQYLEDESREFFIELYKKGITFTNKESFGGEGMGDDYWTVYSFSNKEGEKVYVQFDGWYQSYSGSEFTEWFFVEPKQVTVTKFTRIK